MKSNFRQKEYPGEMSYFVKDFLNQYDYNMKAMKTEALFMFVKVCRDLLKCDFKQPCKYQKVKDLPEDEKDLLIKCLGHQIGVWDLHIYYHLLVKRK